MTTTASEGDREQRWEPRAPLRSLPVLSVHQVLEKPVAFCLLLVREQRWELPESSELPDCPGEPTFCTAILKVYHRIPPCY